MPITLLIWIHVYSLARQPLVDWDEQVYLHLSQSMGWVLDGYSTAGSSIDRALDQPVYSSPVFHHPPTIPLLIKLASLVLPLEVAYKGLLFLFWGTSIMLVYQIGRRLPGASSGLLAAALWALCPVLNLESLLVHLDLPATVFMLGGIYFFLRYGESDGREAYLWGSGMLFALSMLTKFTAPIYVLVPLLLLTTLPRHLRPWPVLLRYGAACSVGMAWWGYILIRFGSLAPPEFVGTGPREAVHFTPYLSALAERRWYDLWIYFLAICPLFVVYLLGSSRLLELSERIRTARQALGDASHDPIRFLGALNISVVLSTVIFSLINARSNGYWTMRHIMPIYPVLYLTMASFVASMVSRRSRGSGPLIGLVTVTLLLMAASTAMTVLTAQAGNLRPIPVLLPLLGLGDLFH